MKKSYHQPLYNLADKMSGLLEGTTFHDQPLNESRARTFIQQGEELLERMNSLLRGASIRKHADRDQA